MTTRREFLIVLASGALGAPRLCTAQQSRVWRVGFLGVRRPVSLEKDLYGVFARGMRELGYVEGRNLVIEWRFADGVDERLPSLAEELVRLNVDVVVAPSTAGSKAAQKATAHIPIVMVNTSSPVENGLVQSLGRPGGNVTGLTNVLTDVGAKHVELLLTLVPKLSLVAVLVNPGSPTHAQAVRDIEERARQRGIRVLRLEASEIAGLRSAFGSIAQRKPGALIVLSHGYFIEQRAYIAELAARGRVPSISVLREYAEAGGLMSYGPSYSDNYRRAAVYVDKIFKGAKPADLPIEQPTTLELVINRKTAKAMALSLPHELLVRANHVIE